MFFITERKHIYFLIFLNEFIALKRVDIGTDVRLGIKYRTINTAICQFLLSYANIYLSFIIGIGYYKDKLLHGRNILNFYTVYPARRNIPIRI